MITSNTFQFGHIQGGLKLLFISSSHLEINWDIAITTVFFELNVAVVYTNICIYQCYKLLIFPNRLILTQKHLNIYPFHCIIPVEIYSQSRSQYNLHSILYYIHYKNLLFTNKKSLNQFYLMSYM